MRGRGSLFVMRSCVLPVGIVGIPLFEETPRDVDTDWQENPVGYCFDELQEPVLHRVPSFRLVGCPKENEARTQNAYTNLTSVQRVLLPRAYPTLGHNGVDKHLWHVEALVASVATIAHSYKN